MSAEELLRSWNDTASKAAVVEYVTRVTSDGPDFVPPAERIATFDNDGTLWCEKPLPIQLAFILKRLVEMAAADGTLRDRQPWRSAVEHDMKWLSDVVAEHYAGDDTNVKVLMGGVLASVAGLTVDEYAEQAAQYVNTTVHPTTGRLFRHCSYLPMVELLRYLEANDIMPFIASGGDRDFMRPFSDDLYGVPAERVIGSSNALRYDDESRTLAYLGEPDVFDDGPIKPVRIWSRVGRRPILAAGNSNGDIPMLRFAGGRHPALRLLILHDDADREFDYTTGAESALARAADESWTVVSIKNDWATVYDEA